MADGRVAEHDHVGVRREPLGEVAPTIGRPAALDRLVRDEQPDARLRARTEQPVPRILQRAVGMNRQREAVDIGTAEFGYEPETRQRFVAHRPLGDMLGLAIVEFGLGIVPAAILRADLPRELHAAAMHAAVRHDHEVEPQATQAAYEPQPVEERAHPSGRSLRSH